MKRLFVVFLTFVLCAPLQTQAERFIYQDAEQNSAETAKILQTVTRKQRFFGRLGAGAEADFFTFTVEKGSHIDVYLETLVSDGDFRPHLILFGQGLPKPSEDPVIHIGDSNGAVIAHAADEREKRFDLFLLTTFHRGPTLSLEAPKQATYGLAVRSSKGSAGRYVLHVGTQNSFRWDELAQGLIGVFRGILRWY